VPGLLEQGHEVICMDNFFTGHIRNIDDLQPNPHFSIIRHDITLPVRFHVDQIYHLACPASPVHYQLRPAQTSRTAVLGSLNMLELAQYCHARVLLASTSEIYGDPSMHPQSESYWGNVNPIGPRSCYDEGKRMAETLAMDFSRQYGVSVKIVRIFNTYGPGMTTEDGRVVSNFICNVLTGTPIEVYGDGNQTRSFCYVSDLVDGMIRMMNADADFTGPVNLGNPDERTIMQVARLVMELTGLEVPIIHKPLPVDDPVRRCPDISLATQRLGWQPLVPFEKGIQQAIPHFRKLLKDSARL
jgi:UDP-glucuronate decarboxylase